MLPLIGYIKLTSFNQNASGTMVFFQHNSDSRRAYLCILDDEKQRSEEGTTLIVGTPLLRRYAPEWPRLTNAFFQSEWSHEHVDATKKKDGKYILRSAHHQASANESPFPTLGRRIIEGTTKWKDINVQFPGEFCYSRGYWEWTEDILSRCEKTLEKADIYGSVKTSLFTYDRNSEIDKSFCEAWCSDTNTLLTSHGELSISLWDLYSCSGLPILGLLFDEVVPSLEELNGKDANSDFFLPRTCKYLFHAYHMIARKSSSVSTTDWIQFWSKKKILYPQPPPRTEGPGKERSRKTYNPLDNHGKHQRWSEAEEAVFSKLNVRPNLKEETFLAAFLACWLCSFVLPVKDVRCIRPGVFKMASLMASGKRVSLAVPVLAAIYRGLNVISACPEPSNMSFFVPIHFVYAWLAQYFKTYYPTPRPLNGFPMVTFSGEGGSKYYNPVDARKRIHKGDSINWTCNMKSKSANLLLVDGPNISDHDRSYFSSLRSGYLTLRQGEKFIIEPYSPHRFSRQFGYLQEIPGVHKFDIREGNLDEGLRFWRVSTLINSMSSVHLPAVPLTPSAFSIMGYKKWWTVVHKRYVKDNIEFLSSSKPSRVTDQNLEHAGGSAADVVMQNGSPKIGILTSPTSKGHKRANAASNDMEDSISSNVDRHWKHQKRSRDCSNVSQPEVDAPSGEPLVNSQHTENLDEKDDFVPKDSDEKTQNSHRSEFVDIENSSNSDTSSQSNATKKSALPAVSKFVAKDFLQQAQVEYLDLLWNRLQQRIGRTPLDLVSSIRDEILIVFESMKAFAKDVDLSSLEALLYSFFDKAASYDNERSTLADRPSQDSIAQRINDMNNRLQFARVNEKHETTFMEATREQLKKLRKKVVKLEASLKTQEESRLAIQAEAAKIEGEIAALKDASSPTAEEIENLESLKMHLGAAYEELKDLKPFA